ncbi:DNA replication terminus site-binding protein [Rheinheimera sp. UJ63]|uniref:DNA replication terminus site-binding protein n=1 Tax=Rheinheimera sp. UJ63 TaxID=2910157 RepID=UPI001F34FC1A|nr:DNA replication terminus site-binding protein [Rheinheimera sp. UJ63]MCF4010617.1 DNA replication terminus site-binding protein [Rheinheimera sp. UJ63]
MSDSHITPKKHPLVDDGEFAARVQLSFADIRSELTLFENELNDHSSLIRAEVFRLPPFHDDDIGEWPEHISVDTITGDDAYQIAMAHLKSMDLEHDHSNRIIPRLPGIICVSHPDPLSMLARLATINKKKADFHQMVLSSHSNRDVRFEALLRSMPNVVKLKAFRGTLFANRALYSVGFTWKNRRASKHLTKKQLLDMLDKTISYYEKRFPLSEKGEAVHEEKRVISQYPATSRFLMTRPLRVAPAMNLRYIKDAPLYLGPDLKAPVDMIAHSPLFVFNQNVKCHPLKPFLADEAPKPKVIDRPLVIKRLSVYFDPIASAK